MTLQGSITAAPKKGKAVQIGLVWIVSPLFVSLPEYKKGGKEDEKNTFASWYGLKKERRHEVGKLSLLNIIFFSNG